MTINKHYKVRRKIVLKHVTFALVVGVLLILLPWVYKKAMPPSSDYERLIYSIMPNFGLGFSFPFFVSFIYLIFNKPNSSNYFSKRNFLPFSLFSMVFVVIVGFWQSNLLGVEIEKNEIFAGLIGAIFSFIYFAFLLLLVERELTREELF